MARISNIIMGSVWGTALYVTGGAQLLGALATATIAAVFFAACDAAHTSKTAARRTY